MSDVLATPGIDSVRRARAAADVESAFWREHHAALVKAYPDQFVAVVKDLGRAVAADPDLYRLIDLVAERGLDLRQVWVRYMAATPMRVALRSRDTLAWT